MRLKHAVYIPRHCPTFVLVRSLRGELRSDGGERQKVPQEILPVESQVLMCRMKGCGGIFLACEDSGRMFDHSFPASAFFLGGGVGGGQEISYEKLRVKFN